MKRKHVKQRTKEEGDCMAVFTKPVDFSFHVSENKAEAFLKKDTKPNFKRAMERLKKHSKKQPK